MNSRTTKFFCGLAAVAALGLMILTATAGSTIKVKAKLSVNCPNCATDVGLWNTGAVIDVGVNPDPNGTYSVLPDSLLKGSDFSVYNNTLTVQSEILTHNAVYTLDTLDSLVNGLVGGSTRTALMHFYTTVSNTAPTCWQGAGTDNGLLEQAVNWSVIADNSVFFTEMQENRSYTAKARMDFNVRPSCDNQIFRYYLKWGKVTITRLLNAPGNKRQWKVVTTSACYPTAEGALNCGEADLYGQGGKAKQTVAYGTFRMPFEMLLVEE